jgi:hypothetical protein
MARDAEPDTVSIPVAITRAGKLSDANLDPDIPVFTHFYMPSAGGSVNAVFGVDLGTPVGQTQGRFVSHPDGVMAVRKEDDLHERVFVAVPPWDLDAVSVFDRRGRAQELTLLDIDPPEERLE